MIQNPRITNATTGQEIECVISRHQYHISIDCDCAFSDVSKGDLLQLADGTAIVLYKESVTTKSKILTGIDALPLSQTATTPTAAAVPVWCHKSGLPTDPAAKLVLASTGPGTALKDQATAVTHLLDAAALLSPGDPLAAQIQTYIADYRQQYRIISAPGSGLSLGQTLTVTGIDQPLKIEAVDRQSIKGLEICTATPINADQATEKPANLFTRLTGGK